MASQSENIRIFPRLSIPWPRRQSPREVPGVLEASVGVVSRVPEVCRTAALRSCSRGSGVSLGFGPLLSRGAAILGKAILPFKGVSGVLAPQAPRTKCQSYPLPHGHFQMLPELKTSAGVRRPGTRAEPPAGPTPGLSAMQSPSLRRFWMMSLLATWAGPRHWVTPQASVLPVWVSSSPV